MFTGLLSLGGILGGSKGQPIPGVPAIKVARSADAPLTRALTMKPGKTTQTVKYHGIIWHTFVVPNFAIPNVACS